MNTMGGKSNTDNKAMVAYIEMLLRARNEKTIGLVIKKQILFCLMFVGNDIPIAPMVPTIMLTADNTVGLPSILPTSCMHCPSVVHKQIVTEAKKKKDKECSMNSSDGCS